MQGDNVQGIYVAAYVVTFQQYKIMNYLILLKFCTLSGYAFIIRDTHSPLLRAILTKPHFLTIITKK